MKLIKIKAREIMQRDQFESDQDYNYYLSLIELVHNFVKREQIYYESQDRSYSECALEMITERMMKSVKALINKGATMDELISETSEDLNTAFMQMIALKQYQIENPGKAH